MHILRVIILIFTLWFLSEVVRADAHILANVLPSIEHLVKNRRFPITVINNGYNMRHPSMIGRWHREEGADCIGFSPFGDDRCDIHTKRPPYMGPSHGTNVAEAIISINPNATVYPIVGLPLHKRRSLDDVAFAYLRAAAATPKIVNMSIGFKVHSLSRQLAFKAMQKAGKLVVVAAGNDGGLIMGGNYPIMYDLPNVIVVGGSVYNGFGQIDIDEVSSFSKKYVHIFAPMDIRFASSTGRVNNFSGTSAASPIVAAIAGMVWQLCPKLDAEEVKKLLMDTSTKSWNLRNLSVSGGTVNAEAAVIAAKKACK